MDKAIIRFFKRVAKVTFFLLIRMWLILPVAFVIGWLIVCASIGVELSDYTAVIVLAVGTSVLGVCSILLTINSLILKRRYENKLGNAEPQQGREIENEEPQKTNIEAPAKKENEQSDLTIKPDEKPLVFATRKDPNLLIKEYSDRLEFYRKSEDGKEIEFIGKEFKG